MKPILIVYKKSALQRYKSNSFLRSSHIQAKRIRESHKVEQNAIKHVVSQLEQAGYDFDMLAREDLQEIKKRKLIITIGGDGTFLDVSHFIYDATPILGINSNPRESVGFYCSATISNFMKVLKEKKITKIPRLSITVNKKKIREQVLNDFLLAHPHPAGTTRFLLNGKEYKSSGLLASTPSGSSGWMYQEGGKILSLTSSKIQYLIRGIRFSKPKIADSLTILSLTPESTLFLDGTHITYHVGLGKEIRVGKGKPLHVIGNLQRKQKLYKKV